MSIITPLHRGIYELLQAAEGCNIRVCKRTERRVALFVPNRPGAMNCSKQKMCGFSCVLQVRMYPKRRTIVCYFFNLGLYKVYLYMILQSPHTVNSYT